jgi:hypothetical protein
MFAALTARGITIISAGVLAAALFALSGCSTLGVATTKETEAMQAWQDSLGRVVYTMNARLANLDSVEAELKRMESESGAAMDSLEVRMDRAQAWVAELGLDEISRDAREAATAADNANRTSLAITDAYLQNIIDRRDALTDHAVEIEALVDSLQAEAVADSMAAEEDSNFMLKGNANETSSGGN